MTTSEELADIFSIFHDGWISAIEPAGPDLRLRIEVEYIAELISPEFTSFTLELSDVTTFAYESWDKGRHATAAEIAALEPEILQAEVEGEFVCVICDHTDPSGNGGGTLTIFCRGYSLFDQHGTPVPVERLQETAKYYWDEVFGKK